MLGVLAVSLHLDDFHCRLFKSLRTGAAELPLVFGQLVQSQAGAFIGKHTYQFTHFQCDFKPIGSGSVASGGNEHAGSAVGVLQIGGHVIFHFDIVPFPFMTESTDAAGHSADPLDQIQIVGALVQQYAAAFTVPSGAPGAGIIIGLGAVPVGDDPVYPLNCTQFSAVHQLVHLTVYAVGALVKHHAKHLAALFSGLVHFPHCQGVHTGRLFAHDVQSLFKGADSQRGVLVVRYCNEHRVADAAVNQLIALIKNFHIFRQVLLRPVPAGLRTVGHSHQLQLRHIAVYNALGVVRTHIAYTDNSDFHLFHDGFLPYVFLSDSRECSDSHSCS